MDHDTIEQYDLVDRYLMGKLAAAESEEFEEHFLTCAACTERLRTTQQFRHDLRLYAVQEAMPGQSAQQAVTPAPLPRQLSRRLLAVAATLLLTATASGIFLLASVQRLRSEVATATSALAQSERRYEEQLQSASQSDNDRREVEERLTEKIRELEARLHSVQKPGSDLSAGAPDSQPAINVPIFVLRAIRGSQNPSDPVNEIAPPRSAPRFLLSIALEDEERYEDYRASIFDERDRRIWQTRGLAPSRTNALSMSFRSDYFPPGTYLLKLEGVTREGDLKLLSNYPFRVKSAP